ncbi:hypothetical protein FB472_2298 [Rhodoglobus vestalii]|uniref:Uncharacterized protein n=1 Tax=Rhodoglobus vestalii TaxID=193384 RepID=A0A8H2K5T7_9MICO|nr:hypothetical protein FB472_2298 [Rhodoglobus vestalii]
MLLSLSGSFLVCIGLVLREVVEPGFVGVLEFRIGAFAKFQAPQALVGDAELVGDFGHGQLQRLPPLAQQWSLRSADLWVGEQGEDLVRDVSFEAADDVAIGETLSAAFIEVGHCAGVFVAAPAEDDAVQRGIGVAVATAGETMSVAHSRGRRDGGNAEERSELRFGADPIWIVTQGRQQGAPTTGPTPWAESSAGLLSRVRSPSWASISTISAASIWVRWARRLRQSLLMWSGVAPFSG